MQGKTKNSSYEPINPELYAEEKNLLVQTNSSTSTSLFSCSECKKGFVDSRTLQRHSVIHKGVRPFSCQDCGKSFMLRGDLTRHLLIHSGKRPFACTVCERRFTLKGNLMQHIRTHTPEKQFTCTLCRKSFSQRESLFRHIRAHFGEKPYRCETCGKSFSLRGDLTRHILIHTGQRPHLCPICSRSFALKGNMMQHMRTHTNCAEVMALREADEDRATSALHYDEPSPTNDSSNEKQIWQVTETINRSDGRISADELRMDPQFPSKQLDNKNGVVHTCLSDANNFVVNVPARPSHCELCTKTNGPHAQGTAQLTYMNPVTPFAGSAVQDWGQGGVACSLCGKPFKNRRYLKLHVERHKVAHQDFTCTHCRKSFLSKSEHFFHFCKGSLGAANANRAVADSKEQQSRSEIPTAGPASAAHQVPQNVNGAQNIKQETIRSEWQY